jgi:hypothetical protein
MNDLNSLNRRSFIASSLVAGFFPLQILKSHKNKIPKHDFMLKLVFENGDRQNLYFNHIKDSYGCFANSMNHTNCEIVTIYNHSSMWNLSQLLDNIETIYTGFDKNNNVCYTGKAKEKIWIDNSGEI